MSNFIMISGISCSGKTDAMIKIVAGNSHSPKHNILWNGETMVTDIVERCEAVKANLSSITIISPDSLSDDNLDLMVDAAITESGSSGFNLYIDDPTRVIYTSDNRLKVSRDSPLNKLIVNADVIYNTVTLRKSGLAK